MCVIFFSFILFVTCTLKLRNLFVFSVPVCNVWLVSALMGVPGASEKAGLGCIPGASEIGGGRGAGACGQNIKA